MPKSISFNEKVCSCPVGISTTNKEHYLQPENVKLPIIEKLQEPCDIDLISGHIGNNLRFNEKPVKSKTWSKVLEHAESYEDFMKRLKTSKADVFNLYFNSSSDEKKTFETMFKNFNKTAYQLSYSPDIFVPRTERRRFAKLERGHIPTKYTETTYRTYFCRDQEMQHYKDLAKTMQYKEKKDDLKNDLRKIRYCVRSTYNDEVSAVGKIYAKATLPGPIDRYTLRKV